MDPDNFDEALGQARQILAIFREVYKDVTGEDFDLESAVRHSPVLVLGVAAGAGALAGWWFGRRRPAQLPPPPSESNSLVSLSKSREFIEENFPEAVERVREKLPQIEVSDELKQRARTWVDTMLERELGQNVDNLAESLDVRLSSLFRKALDRLGPEEDVRLDDPEQS